MIWRNFSWIFLSCMQRKTEISKLWLAANFQGITSTFRHEEAPNQPDANHISKYFADDKVSNLPKRIIIWQRWWIILENELLILWTSDFNQNLNLMNEILLLKWEKNKSGWIFSRTQIIWKKNCIFPSILFNKKCIVW